MRRSCAAVIGLVASATLVTVTLAQQRGSQPPPQQPPGPPTTAAPPAAPTPGLPPKPWVPVAASTLAAHPDAYYGEYVSMTGAVEQLLSKSAFSVDQDRTKSTGQEVLVLVPTMQSSVDANAYVTVLGEVVKFDPSEVGKKAKDYKIDLPADAVSKFQGRPAIIATSVINQAGLDVAKRLPPPMTADELELQKVMRQVGPANTALRGAIDKSDVPAVKEQTTVLAKAFAQTEAFWKTRGKPDAVKWATDARTQAQAIDTAAAAGKWDDVKTSAGTLGQQCQSCHGTYRERFDDGSFRIKK
jgi:cytochrome c556